MKKLLFLIFVSLLLVGTATANTVWDPANNGIFPPDVGAWGDDPNNWSNGTPGPAAPADTKAVFNVTGAAECQVTDAQTCVDLVQGDNGPGGVLRIVEGGDLVTTGGWMAVGYNSTAQLIVEEGGSYNHGGHFWWGMHTGGDGIVEINGGTVYNTGSFGLGEWFGPVGDHGQCKVYINDGELNIHHWSGAIDSDHPVFWNDSLIDIRHGKMIIRNDSEAAAQEYIAAGKITAFGLVGAATAVFADGVTTITAIGATDRVPEDGAWVEYGDVDLTWTNIESRSYADPNFAGTDTYVDVWFGTDPNKLGSNYYKILSKAPNVTSYTVSTVPGTYYWQVDSYYYDNPVADDTLIEGKVFSFTATDDSPPSSIVIETPDTLTWAGEPVTLTATVTDDLTSVPYVVWSVDPAIDPNIAFTNEIFVYPTATVTVTGDSELPNITVTATAGDSMNGDSVTDTMILDIAADACQAARGNFLRRDLLYIADTNADCIIDLADLIAEFASAWLYDYALNAPIVITQ